MKTEIKMIVISFVLIFLYIGIFTYCVNAMQKDFHVLQVGIYSKEENKNQKINELKDKGMVAEYYKQDGKFYIISFLSDNLDDVEKYQKERDNIIADNVLELSARVLKEIGGMKHLNEMNYAFLTSIKGIKQAKAIEILGVIEFAKRMHNINYQSEVLNDPHLIYQWMKNKMMFLNQEHFVVLCLDTKSKRNI